MAISGIEIIIFVKIFFKNLLLVTIFIVPFILLVLFAYQDIAPTGIFETTYNLNGYHPFVSKLYPKGRLSFTEKSLNTGYEQKILAEPVYFDVRIPRALDVVTLKIWYKGDSDNLNIGLRLPPAPDQQNWRYELKKFSSVIVVADGWQVGEVQFDFKKADIQKNKIRFMLSLPSVQNLSTPFIFHKVSVRAIGQPLSIKNVWSLLVKYVLTRVYDK